MTITFDAASTASKTSGIATTFSWNHTVSDGTNSMLIVAAGIRTTASSLTHTTNITYAGTPLTRAVFARNETASSAIVRTELWYLLNPTSGTNAIEETFANSTFSVACGQLAASYKGTTGIGNTAATTGQSSQPGVIINISSDSVPFNAAKSMAAVTLSTQTGETIRAVSTAGTDFHGISEGTTGFAGNQALNWTGGVSTFWAIAALEILNAQAIPGDGGGADLPRSRLVMGVGR